MSRTQKVCISGFMVERRRETVAVALDRRQWMMEWKWTLSEDSCVHYHQLVNGVQDYEAPRSHICWTLIFLKILNDPQGLIEGLMRQLRINSIHY